MSYLKSLATSFVYIAFFLAVITFAPGLPPVAEFTEYSIKSPVELTGTLAPNDRLNAPEILFNGEIKGPESFDSYNGELFTGLHGGNVAKIVGKKIIPVVKFGKKCGGIWDEEQCGRPLGLKFDKHGRLYVADSYYGIFKVDVKTGKYERLFDASQPIDGKVPAFINSVDVAANGDVYWTDSSTEFKLLDGAFAMLANPSGRLIRFNAATKKNEVLLRKIGLANGLKLSDDESYIIVAETMTSVLLKYRLKGEETVGKREIFVDGLAGMPDNIHSDGQGNYLVSLIVPADPQHPILAQTLIPHPYVRKMLARLLGLAEMPFKLLDDLYPNDFAKKVVHAIGSFETSKFLFAPRVTVLRISADGKIIDALYNSDEKTDGISSAFIHDNYLWLGSPFNQYLARVPINQAFPNTVFTQKPRGEPRVTREAVPPKVVTEKKPKTATTAKPEQKIEKKTRPEEPERKQQAPKKVEPTPKPPKKEIPVRENEIPQQQQKKKQEKPAKKVVNEIPQQQKKQEKPPTKKVESRATTEEVPKPVKQAKPAEPAKPKQQQQQQENAKAAKTAAESSKRSTKIADEI